jgi:hypothetical protein
MTVPISDSTSRSRNGSLLSDDITHRVDAARIWVTDGLDGLVGEGVGCIDDVTEPVRSELLAPKEGAKL